METTLQQKGKYKNCMPQKEKGSLDIHETVVKGRHLC